MINGMMCYANAIHFPVFNIFTLVLVSASWAAAQQEAGQESIKKSPNGERNTSEIHLAPHPGFSDDASVLASVAARVTDLKQQSKEATDPQRSAELLLAAANLVLAEEMEPACSRKFFQLDDPTPKEKEIRIAAALAGVDEMILAAVRLVQPTKPDATAEIEKPSTDEQAKNLNRDAVTLKAFAQALRAYLLREGTEADPSRSSRRAASGLSVLVEDDNPQIAAAAGFWQAALRAMESDPTPALDILEPVTNDIHQEAPRFGFFSRLLRCRLVAARGGAAAALALVLQVEERTSDWFKADADQAEAMRACAWLRLQILKDWYEKLDSTAQTEEREWCRSQIDRLRANQFSDSSASTVLRLKQAIPMIVRVPEPKDMPPTGKQSPD